MEKRLLFILCALWVFLTAPAQNTKNPKVETALGGYFSAYSLAGYRPTDPMQLQSCRVDEPGRTITLTVNDAFASQPFTPESVRAIYASLRKRLPAGYGDYRIVVCDKRGRTIDGLIPNPLREDGPDRSRLWGDIRNKGNAWVTNLSRPYVPDRGLEGHHLSLWASHGRYFDGKQWEWQRPYLFCTTEDLFTQTIVVPYLIPMLENAGAVVFTPRERDWQQAEAVVDNDYPGDEGSYVETASSEAFWQDTPTASFAPLKAAWENGENPFRQGTSRQVPTTSHHGRTATATWTPRLPRAGRYAVYVSYATLPGSVSDALYTVYHRGGSTRFRVNQRMGGGTWVYLGTFDFDEGESRRNCVVLTNESHEKGVVTADGVRFGGGRGNISRGGSTSGLLRALEGARYWAQWAGMDADIYDTRDKPTDYPDDINARSYMTNYLAGGSCYLPGEVGLGVPIELSLAVHSDAGIRDGNQPYGSLAVCTTQGNDDRTRFLSSVSRGASFDFSHMLLTTLTADLTAAVGQTWTRRELWDRNYSETRNPEVPSAIIEMLSHQNFTDMVYGHDPNFKFVLARALYKSVLKFVSYEHEEKHYTVQPLPVHDFSAVFTDDGQGVRLAWSPTPDPNEPSADPVGYVVYTRAGDGSFDNGVYIKGRPMAVVPITPGVQYSFRVTAVNRGGESFPSEVLTACYRPDARQTVLIVNGFQRLSPPAVVHTADSLGFDLNADIGVAYERTAGFAGAQVNFAPSNAGREGAGGLGFSGNELEGTVIAGNTFDYPYVHGQSMWRSKRCSFVSCSRGALLSGQVRLAGYAAVDLVLGVERATDYGLRRYKTFDARLRSLLTDYCRAGGRLLVSGAYIGSDMTEADEQRFTRDVLKYSYAGSARQDNTGTVRGLNLDIPIYRTPGEEHYAVQAPDAIAPAAGAFCAFAYGGGLPAGTAYRGDDYRVIAIGFPFECIRSRGVRDQAMDALLRFLLEP